MLFVSKLYYCFSMFVKALIFLLTFAGMELFSWLVHKYLFHGPLWFIHKTHHQPQKTFFEWNDLFSLSFALTAMWLMWQGQPVLDYRFWMGCGITAYGLVYFIIHDVFVHQRTRAFKSNNPYLIRLRKAHKIHHKSLHKTPSESFGLLWTERKHTTNT